MTNKALKVLLTTVVLTGAFVCLMWATMQDGTQYYKKVDEVMVEPQVWQGKRLQVHGYAANVLRHPKSLDWRFEIRDSVENHNYVVHAEYNGIVPDTFDNHAEVVVSGIFTGDRFIVGANGIMAKCPSKYEPKPSLGRIAEGGTNAGEGQTSVDTSY